MHLIKIDLLFIVNYEKYMYIYGENFRDNAKNYCFDIYYTGAYYNIHYN